MKPLIILDFNGAILKSRPFDESQKKWYKLFSVLLEDDSINEWMSKENIFEGVYVVMKKYLGDTDKISQRIFARQLYAMMLVSEVNIEDLMIEYVDYLRTLKERYTIALLTAAPKGSIDPILHKLNCADVFDIIFASEYEVYPNKRALLDEFITKYETPLFYIGKGDAFLGELKELGIITISVNWFSKGNFKGDHEVSNVDQLKNIL